MGESEIEKVVLLGLLPTRRLTKYDILEKRIRRKYISGVTGTSHILLFMTCNRRRVWLCIILLPQERRINHEGCDLLEVVVAADFLLGSSTISVTISPIAAKAQTLRDRAKRVFAGMAFGKKHLV